MTESAITEPSPPLPTRDYLRACITREIYKIMGLSPDSPFWGWVRWLCWLPVDRFAGIAADFDKRVRVAGFSSASSALLERFVSQVKTHGTENIPRQGPLLIIANHPGAYDALVIASRLARDDLAIVASGIPLLRSLTSARQHFIFSNLETGTRMNVIRSCVRHLAQGGALLIFPGGRVEPDPAFLPHMEQALERWSPSVEIMLRKVPETRLVISFVSHILSPAFRKIPITNLPRLDWERQRMAELLQVLYQLVFSGKLLMTPRVSFSQPQRLANFTPVGSPQRYMPEVIARAQACLEQHRCAGFV